MSDNLCRECHKEEVLIKKHQLCATCYGRLYRAGKLKSVKSKIGLPPNKKELHQITIVKQEREGEFLFVRNFFNHDNWLHQPALFHFDGKSYRPDFYDVERNMWIEVSRTRQAYFANKEKYQLFREHYPLLNFEIRTPTGEILDETMSINSQLNPQEVP